jgi:spore maturation protein SpmA
MLNWIWLAMLIVAVLVGGFTGRMPELTKGAFETAEVAVMKIALPLVGIMAIWLGIMRLAERAGLVQIIAQALRPVLRRLFPDVPADHPAMGAMVMNMAANMLGLGNAATPLGLRAMQHLERLNPHPGTATNAMCTFLAINTASIQLVPTTAIALLAVAGSKNPTAIVVTAFLATCCSAASGVTAAKLLERLPMFRVKNAAPAEPSSLSSSPSPKEGEKDEGAEKDEVKPPPLSARGRVVVWLFTAAFAWMFVLLAFPEFANGLLAPLKLAAPRSPAEMAGKGPLIRSLFAVSILAVPFLLSFFPLYAALRGVKV